MRFPGNLLLRQSCSVKLPLAVTLLPVTEFRGTKEVPTKE